MAVRKGSAIKFEILKVMKYVDENEMNLCIYQVAPLTAVYESSSLYIIPHASLSSFSLLIKIPGARIRRRHELI
jgi:hypothetical protein